MLWVTIGMVRNAEGSRIVSYFCLCRPIPSQGSPGYCIGLVDPRTLLAVQADFTWDNACNIRVISLNNGPFMGAFVVIRRDLRAFPEKFFFTLSVFTREKMGELACGSCHRTRGVSTTYFKSIETEEVCTYRWSEI
jgi:hypothetical protein